MDVCCASTVSSQTPLGSGDNLLQKETPNSMYYHAKWAAENADCTNVVKSSYLLTLLNFQLIIILIWVPLRWD